MTAKGAHKITEDFEKKLSEYTGAPFTVCVDNASNALFLCLMYEDVGGMEIEIPNRTYPSVPCEILHSGGVVKFKQVEKETIKGCYRLKPTKIWDSALTFTHDMYIYDSHMCLSFTGPYKHLKLGKGGAILTDDEKAYKWFKRARFSGRRECSYHDDNLDMLGWNFYMMPDVAARGLLLMSQFYDIYGNPIPNEDKEIGYPDLSKFSIYTKYTKYTEYTE